MKRDACIEDRRMYWIWAAMIQRCTNPNTKQYADYGGAGVCVCDRWRNFDNFFADMGARPDGAMIDRIDNSKGYAPENCRWATRQVQNCNKGIYRINHFGISGIEPRDGKFRVRVRHKGRIVINRTVPDFFEACCIRKRAELEFILPILEAA